MKIRRFLWVITFIIGMGCMAVSCSQLDEMYDERGNGGPNDIQSDQRSLESDEQTNSSTTKN